MFSTNNVKLPDDAERINVAEKYGLDPAGDKCVVFCWLERGLSLKAVRYLAIAKKYLHLSPKSITAYYKEWVKKRRKRDWKGRTW